MLCLNLRNTFQNVKNVINISQKKVVELEIKLVLDFHIYGSSCLEVFCRKDVQEILQNSQENTCARDNFSINLQERIKNALRKNL